MWKLYSDFIELSEYGEETKLYSQGENTDVTVEMKANSINL